MKRTVSIDVPIYGRVEATWERKGRNIVVRYGDREKPAAASEDDTANDIIARDVLRSWVRDDLKDEE